MHTLEQLTAFVAVYESGSYSQAARQLNKARGTVRELVMVFEDLLDYPLFEIEGRKAIPTEHAKNLYQRARLIVRQNEEFSFYSQSFPDGKETKVSIAYEGLIPSKLITSIETKVADIYPGLELNWYLRNRQEGLELLTSGEVDLMIAVSRGRLFPEKQVGFITLGWVRFLLCVGATSPLASHESLTLRQLRLEQQYVLESLLVSEPARWRVSPQCHTVTSGDALCHLLEDRGWAILPDHMAQPHIEQGRLKAIACEEITTHIQQEQSLFYLHQSQARPVRKQVINWMQEIAAKELG